MELPLMKSKPQALRCPKLPFKIQDPLHQFLSGFSSYKAGFERPIVSRSYTAPRYDKGLIRFAKGTLLCRTSNSRKLPPTRLDICGAESVIYPRTIPKALPSPARAFGARRAVCG
jgi:hypothetical protein